MWFKGGQLMSGGTVNRLYDKKRKVFIDLLLAQSSRSGATMVVVISLVGFVVWSQFPRKTMLVWLVTGYILNLSRYYIYQLINKWAVADRFYFRLELTLAACGIGVGPRGNRGLTK
jgi:hypothetical protein